MSVLSHAVSQTSCAKLPYCLSNSFFIFLPLPLAQDLESILMLSWWSELATGTFIWESFSRASIFCSGCTVWRGTHEAMDWCSSADIAPAISVRCHGRCPWPMDSDNHAAGSGWGQRTKMCPATTLTTRPLLCACCVACLSLWKAFPGSSRKLLA